MTLGNVPRLERLRGALLGGALGDSLGLVFEGLPPARVAALWPRDGLGFVLPGGAWISDDTEHAFFTGLALLDWYRHRDAEEFGKALLGHFRGWILALPPALGMATARAGFWACLGLSHHSTGVFSAGNGPLMRAPILGAGWSGEDLDGLHELVDRSTRITHTDPIVVRSARLAGALAATPVGAVPACLEGWLAELPPGPNREYLEKAREAARDQLDGPAYARLSGFPRGVSGFAPHSLGAALFAALSHPGDLPGVLEEALRLGGDTDSVGALAGALAGAWYGPSSLPEPWLRGLESPFLGLRHLEALASSLATPGAGDPLADSSRLLRRPPWVVQLPRNLGFLGLCLAAVPWRWLAGRRSG